MNSVHAIPVNPIRPSQSALLEAIARAQSNFIADGDSTRAFDAMLKDLLLLTGSEFGFIGENFRREDGTIYLKTHAITNIAWNEESRRFYAENAPTGLEFTNLNTLFGAVLTSGKPMIANDPLHHPHRGGLPPGHPPLLAFLGLPIHAAGKFVGMAGIANRPNGYDEDLVQWIMPLMATIGQLVEARRELLARKATELDLQKLNLSLELLVDERTRTLSDTLQTLRLAQTELVRSERLASLGTLVAGVAHELNTPIGNAVLAVSVLCDREKDFSARLECNIKRSELQEFMEFNRASLEVLKRNLDRVASIIESFKELAVDQSSFLRRKFSLKKLVNEVLMALSPTLRQADIQVDNHVDHKVRLNSYPGPLGHVLINLVNNAVVHAFDGISGRKITIECAMVGNDRIVLRVRDNGNGVADKVRNHIFDPFVTTKMGRGGAGLGLHIVYTLVSGLLGGQVVLEQRSGSGGVGDKGACFVLDLPVNPPQRDDEPGGIRLTDLHDRAEP